MKTFIDELKKGKPEDFNKLVDKILSSFDLSDKRLHPTIRSWFDSNFKNFELENELFRSAHQFSNDSFEISINMLRKDLEEDLLISQHKLLKFEKKRLNLDLKESIALVDGYDLSEKEEELLYITGRVGRIDEQKKQRLYSEMFEYSKWIIGLRDNEPELDLCKKLGAFNIVFDVSVTEFIRDFEKIVKQNDEEFIARLKDMVSDQKLARTVASNSDLPDILRTFCVLAINDMSTNSENN